MSTPEDFNPWDTSIPDPVDPEGPMIEDPWHGPAAVQRMLDVPPMPLGDGTYYRAGGFYTQEGSVYVDPLDRPVKFFGRVRSTSAFMREVKDFEEWRLANKEGEYAATITRSPKATEAYREEWCCTQLPAN